jgi:hypothetical protein
MKACSIDDYLKFDIIKGKENVETNEERNNGQADKILKSEPQALSQVLNDDSLPEEELIIQLLSSVEGENSLDVAPSIDVSSSLFVDKYFSNLIAIKKDKFSLVKEDPMLDDFFIYPKMVEVENQDEKKLLIHDEISNENMKNK